MSSSQAQPARSPWIHSAPYDLAFFIATPLLCLAVFLPLAGTIPSLSIYLAVMAFSSFGHHLPGFLRAYGDADLFKRFRWRFLLAPPLLYAVFFYFGQREWNGMLLFLMAWSIWHVTMQHFGFMRIYDAKAGQTSRGVAWLDRALTLLWFAAIVLWSPQYSHDLLANLSDSGGPLLPAGSFIALRNVVFAATGLVTLAWVGNLLRLRSRGEPVSGIKILLHLTTISFLAYVWVGLGDLVLGLAIWEVFHDVQYFAITWVHNRRLVEKGQGSTKFMRFLFRKRTSLVLLYVGAIVAYGSLNWWIVKGAEASMQTALLAFVFTSTALHYYYDGFIWKVRSESTRAGLDLEAGSSVGFSGLSPGLRSGVLQVLAFAVPIGSLAAMQVFAERERGTEQALFGEVEKRETICAIAPGSHDSHRNLAIAYSQVGRLEEAQASFEAALAIREDDGKAHDGLGTTLLELYGNERAADAEQHLLRAIELLPEDPTPGVNLAILRFGQKRTEEAVATYRDARARSQEWQPRSSSELVIGGVERLAARDLIGARGRLENALKVDPNDTDAMEALLVVLQAERDVEGAGQILDRLHALQPDRAEVELALIQNQLLRDRVDLAVPKLEAWIAARPDDLDRKLMLAEVRASHPQDEVRDGKQAVALASEVVRLGTFKREFNTWFSLL
ncbi:MAG: hypothetical protein AAF368_03830 [Planctomycetota bacterium]